MNGDMPAAVLQTLLDEFSVLGMVCFDRTGRIVSISRGFGEQLCGGAGFAEGDSFASLWQSLRQACSVDPGDFGALASLRAAALAVLPGSVDGEPTPVELRYRDVPGREGLGLLLARAVQAPPRLPVDDEPPDTIFDTDDALAWIDTDLRYRTISSAYLRLWGKQRGELLGQWVGNDPFGEILLPYLRRCLAAEQGISFLEHIDFLPGEPRCIETTMRPHRSADGAIAGVLASVRDVSVRMQQSQALADSERRVRALLHAMPDLVFRLDRAGTFLDYKAAREDLALQEPESLVGWRLSDIGDPAFERLILAKIHATLEQDKLQYFDYELMIPGKGMRAWEARMVSSGEDEVVATVRDATEQRADAKRLQMLAQAVEQSPDAILLTDTEFRITYLNRSFEALYGWTLLELQGQTPDRLNAEVDLPERQAQIYAVLQAGRDVHNEDLNRRRDGSLFYCEYWIVALRDEEGQVIGYMGSQRDVSERVVAQRTLEGKEAFNRRIIETAQEGIWVIDADTRTTFANPHMQQMLGYDESEMIGRPLASFMTAASACTARQLLSRNRAGERLMFEFEFLRSDGSRMTALVSATPLFAADGGFDGAFAMITDISERVQVEAERQLLIEQQDILLDHSPALILFKDTRNNIVRVTRSVAEATGLTREQIEGRPSAEVYPDMAERYFETDRQVMRTGVALHGIVEPLSTRGGGQRWLRTDKIPYRDKMGVIRGIVVFSMDITAQRQAELELAASEQKYRTLYEQKYRTLYEQIPQGVVLHARDGHIIDANPAACRMLGLGPGELPGASLAGTDSYCLKDDGSHFPDQQHPAAVALRSGESVHQVIMGVSHAVRAEPVWLLVDAVPLRSEGGLDGVFTSFTDITELRRLQHALMQTQKLEALGHLSAGIAHDFNNILGSVLGYAELAQLRLLGTHPQVEGYLQQIDAAAGRARDLVRQLLVFSRGETPVDATLATVGDLVDEAFAMLRTLLPANIAVEWHKPETSPLLRIAPVHLQQILMNLVVNARDAMPHGGSLGVSVGSRVLDHTQCVVCRNPLEGEWVQIRIADTGEGIALANFDPLFQPFFTTKPVGKGSGMGLAVVAGLLRTYDGHLLLSSTPGRGSEFVLLFPPGVAGG